MDISSVGKTYTNIPAYHGSEKNQPISLETRIIDGLKKSPAYANLGTDELSEAAERLAKKVYNIEETKEFKSLGLDPSKQHDVTGLSINDDGSIGISFKFVGDPPNVATSGKIGKALKQSIEQDYAKQHSIVLQPDSFDRKALLIYDDPLIDIKPRNDLPVHDDTLRYIKPQG
ncbi:MAG: hypothetical protein LBL50_04540 [Candidatus Margulisbacteria bacterium]|jgi:hypothetical protein|nr:hypothetical protein [Candidatus Margulisiibacteriota bacterium]